MGIIISAPASKSVSHRGAIAACLANGQSELINVLESEDINRTLSCLQALGAKIERQGKNIIITGLDFQEKLSNKNTQNLIDLNVGESGTTCRLITPVAAALGSHQFYVHGQGRMHQRPIGELAQALREQNTEFIWPEKKDYPPFFIKSNGLKGGVISISLQQSSQYLSGLLLAAPLCKNRLTITLKGSKIVSLSYVALTIQVMEAFGVKVKIQSYSQGDWQETSLNTISQIKPGQTRFIISPQTYKPQRYVIEGDWSNSSYFLAAGLLLPGGVTLTDINPDSFQGDKYILHILKLMGARYETNETQITINPKPLQGIDIDMGDCPDLVPTVAVLASLARDKSTIRNVAHLRIKESDRLQALANEISKTGCQTKVLTSDLIIEPKPIPKEKTIYFNTYGDHRLAMSLTLYELAGINVQLDNHKCVNKSFPDFWKKWNYLKTQL